MLESTFYCDESGNTGTNWLDVDQKFFVNGGWLVPNSRENDIITGIENIFTNYKGKELKAVKFFKMGNPNKYFLEMIMFMVNTAPAPCFPLFIVAEKEYGVATKMMETFFDPAYNSALKDGITSDIELKKQLGEIIMGKDVAKSFSELIHYGDISLIQMKQIKDDLAREFSSMPDVCKNVADLTDNELSQMIAEFQGKNNTRTLTITVLHHLMQVLQKFCQNYELETTIIHDEIRGYDELLGTIKKIFLSEGGNKVIKIGSFEFNSKLKNIKDLNLGDSKTIKLIQVSDLLCGFISRCFLKIDNEEQLDDIEKEIMQLMFELHDEYHTWDYIFSKKFLLKYCRAIDIGNDSSFAIIDHQSVNKAFCNQLR